MRPEMPPGMQPVPLASTGLQITRMVFGGAPIGGLFAPVSAAGARATLEAAWACGVRAFDTAPHYGVGLSEQRLGEFLGGKPRDQFVISTKVGRRLVAASADAPPDGADGFYGAPRLSRVRDYSRDGVLASLEASLTRLGLDRIDIALIHDPDDHAAEALDGAFRALAELRTAGVIGAIGVGMNQAPLLEWFVRRADLDCVLVAGRHSLLDGQAAATLFPACQHRGVAVLAGGIFNTGLLVRPGPGATYDYAPAPAALLDRAHRIATVCARHGTAIGAAALQFVLAHPAVTAAVIGVRSPAEMTQDAGFLAACVPDGLWAELAAEGLLPVDRIPG
jgi:D-threo-aldose 1-dehydrogenase